MEEKIKTRLRRTMVIFWLLLVYVIAALVWWFISLEKQSNQLYASYREQLISTTGNDPASTRYNDKITQLNNAYKRNRFKYIGEGVVFLGLILLGAAFIFRSLRKQILLQKQQQNFMMAVTHELKTPIAIAKLNLETLLKHHLDEQKQKKLIQTSLDETRRLDFLTNNILVSSQLEDRGYRINKEELDLSYLLKDRVHEFRKRYPERMIHDIIEENVDINGDALLLQILVNNLLENAIKYSEKEERIEVRLSKKNNTATLQVTDEGIGIDVGERKKIFSKFYRIGNEATRKKQGTGLGLYLCNKIAKDHNADILVTNHSPKGSIFAVQFQCKFIV